MMLNDSPFLQYVENITNLKQLHFLIRCKYDTKYMPETVPLFYKQMLKHGLNCTQGHEKTKRNIKMK